jgi:hypothetical protein
MAWAGDGQQQNLPRSLVTVVEGLGHGDRELITGIAQVGNTYSRRAQVAAFLGMGVEGGAVERGVTIQRGSR